MFLRSQDVTAGGQEPLKQAGVEALFFAAGEAHSGKRTLLPEFGHSRGARLSVTRAVTETLVAAGRRTPT
jgi:hypothetical protein